jgi:PhnB protein
VFNEEPALDPEDLEVAGTFHSSQEAEAARDALHAAGIRAYLADEFPEDSNRALRGAFGGLPLLVPAGDLAAARKVVEALAVDEEAAAPLVDTSYIRHSVGAVRPYLYGGLDLLKFVEELFGALELERHEFSATALHVEVMIADSVIAMEVSDPPHATATPGSVYVYVADVDEVYAKALESGAISVAKPSDKPYDERSAGVKDSFGNTWWLSTYTGA